MAQLLSHTSNSTAFLFTISLSKTTMCYIIPHPITSSGSPPQCLDFASSSKKPDQGSVSVLAAFLFTISLSKTTMCYIIPHPITSSGSPPQCLDFASSSKKPDQGSVSVLAENWGVLYGSISNPCLDMLHFSALGDTWLLLS